MINKYGVNDSEQRVRRVYTTKVGIWREQIKVVWILFLFFNFRFRQIINIFYSVLFNFFTDRI